MTCYLFILLPLTAYDKDASLSLTDMQQKELITSQGTWRYAVSNHGSKAILFIHGANSSHRIWHHQYSLSLTGYKNIFVNLLGYGGSDKPDGGYGLANWIEGLNQLLKQEQLEEICIVAHSNGVLFAKEFYRAFPHKVSRMLLLDGMLKPMIPPQSLNWMKSTLERSDYETFMADQIRHMPVQGLSEADVVILKQDARQTPKGVRMAEFDLITDDASWQELQIDCPLTIVHADSPFWTEEYIDWLGQIAPGHRLILWKDSGHFIPMQHADRLNRLIRELVEKP